MILRSFRSVLHRIPRRISLAGLLILTTVLSLGFADIAMDRREQQLFRGQLQALSAAGGGVTDVSLRRRWPRFWRTEARILGLHFSGRDFRAHWVFSDHSNRSTGLAGLAGMGGGGGGGLGGLAGLRDETGKDPAVYHDPSWESYIGLILSFPKVESLSLVECHLTDDDLLKLAALKRIKRMDLSGNPISGKSLENIQFFSRLEVLRVADTDLTLGKLAQLRLPKLRAFDISGCDGGILDLTPNGFGGFPNLEVLSLANCNYIVIETDPARPMRRLTHFDVGDADVELDGVFSVLPSIQRIGVDPHQMTAPVCNELAKAISLEEIGLPPSACWTCIDCESVKLGSVTMYVEKTKKDKIEAAVAGLMSSRPSLKVTWVRAHPDAPSFGYRCGQRSRGKGFDGALLPAEFLPERHGGGFF